MQLRQKAKQEAVERAERKRQQAAEELKKAKIKEMKMGKQKKAELKKRPLVPVSNGSIFSFLELPAEIRNMIYHHLLVDHAYTIRFQATVSSRDGRSIVTRLSRARPRGPDRDDIPGQTKGSITLASNSYKPCISNFDLGINIFLANQQINAESSPIFYSANMFNFEGVPDLYAFLCHFQHRLPLISKLGLSSVTSNRNKFHGALYVQNMRLYSVFPLLASAVNLEALYMHAPVWQSLGGRADIASRSFFQMGWTWMHACALAKGNKLAALDVVKLPDITSELDQYGKWQVEKAGQALFRRELAGYLAPT